MPGPPGERGRGALPFTDSSLLHMVQCLSAAPPGTTFSGAPTLPRACACTAQKAKLGQPAFAAK